MVEPRSKYTNNYIKCKQAKHTSGDRDGEDREKTKCNYMLFTRNSLGIGYEPVKIKCIEKYTM